MRYREVIRLPWWTYAVFAGLASLLLFTFAAVVGVPAALVISSSSSHWAGLIWRRSTLISASMTNSSVGSQTLPLLRRGKTPPLWMQSRCAWWLDRIRTPGNISFWRLSTRRA